ncbi:MAG TPA: peptide chain release factor N(5)-glutamine methyltransferase [Thioploca sp.]|nr:peptide chain release factor N(5)-glutamine methyltransferase [Thioploca sp.]
MLKYIKNIKLSPSISQIINISIQQLSNYDTPRLDAEILLCHVLKKNRSYLYTWPENQLTEKQYQQFRILLSGRIDGKPIAYLIGHKEFWSLELQVTEDTLIPRPETELLVEQVLAHLPLKTASKVIDLGTGTGAIALAIAKERPYCNIIATDKSPQTLQIAKNNAKNLALHNIKFIVSDWFAKDLGIATIIVSNPPYISIDDPHLNQGDVRYEPRNSLISGIDGLTDIRQIILQSYNHLLNKGWLLLEHGYDQAKQVRDLLVKNNYFSIETYNDLADKPRVTVGQKIN